MHLKESYIYQPGMPHQAQFIDAIEIQAEGIAWLKVIISKVVEFSTNSNNYLIRMCYKSPILDQWVSPISWDYSIKSGKGLLDLVNAGKAAFAQPEAIFEIGVLLEEELVLFERRAKVHETRLDEFKSKIQPAFIPKEKEQELSSRIAAERAKQMDIESKNLAIESELIEVMQKLGGDVSPLIESELRRKLTIKYFGLSVPPPSMNKKDDVQTLADVSSSMPDISSIQIDVSQTE